MTQLSSHPLRNAIWAVSRPVRLRWVGLWQPKLSRGWRVLWPEIRPRKIRWGWVLLLVTVLFLAMGEFGPAASAFVTLP
jgi:hypothetical protein